MSAPRYARRRSWAALVVGLFLLAGCTTVVNGQGSPASLAASSSGTGSAPSGTGTPVPSATSSVPSTPATCPVTDRRAGLKFTCLQPKMISVPTSSYTTQVLFQTQKSPDWYMSEVAVLVNTKAGLKTAVGLQLVDFVTGSFPPGSTGKSVSERSTTVGGKTAYVVDGRVTIKRVGENAGLKATQDRVLLLAVDRGHNVASILILDVPDTNKASWPFMDRIAGSVTLV